jgi:F0F1-type ATP synthase delta subunit
MKQAYVTALTNSLLSGLSPEVALVNIKALLSRKGHMRLWPQILRATKRVLEAKLKSHIPQVTVSKSGVVTETKIKSALAMLGVAETEAYTEVVDTTLVGGFTARFKGKLIDQSYKRALVNLYLNITKS